MPIFKVAVEVEFYMEAEDEEDAHFEAESRAREALGDGGATTANIFRVTDPARVPKEWLDALPYNGDGETTIRAILAAPPEDQPEECDDRTLDMFDPAAGGGAGRGR